MKQILVRDTTKPTLVPQIMIPIKQKSQEEDVHQELSHGWQNSYNRDAILQWQVAGVCVPSLAYHQVKEVDNPPGAPSKDRRQESVAGPKSEEMVPPLNWRCLQRPVSALRLPDTLAAKCLNRACAQSIDDIRTSLL